MTTVTERISGRVPGRRTTPDEGGAGDVGAPTGTRPTPPTGTRPTPPTGTRPTPPTGTRDRRALVAVGSLVVIGACVAAFAGLYASAGHRTAAVVVDRSLVQGQPITASDLGQADVSVSAGVGYIPVAEASVIEGKRAAAAVPAGSLLTAGDLASAPAVAAGDAVVGVALKDGQFPAGGLTPGEQVLVVQTGIPGSPLSAPASAPSAGTSTTSATASDSALVGTGTGVLVPVATVVSVTSPDPASGGTYALLVSVEVASVVAPVVATASSADQVGLVLLPASAPSSSAARNPAGITATTTAPTGVGR